MRKFRPMPQVGRRLAAAAMLLLATALPGLATQRLHALVIGIDDYDHIGSLTGAVNDANDIADALGALPGADVTLLLNRDATREAILGQWRSKALAARPGDTLVVSYAGHGGREPEAYPGNETDGYDETLLLSGFAQTGPAAAHRIRDDEIAEIIGLLDPGVTLIFVADSCHSGTVVRGTRKIRNYRYYAGGQIVDDPLPPPPPKTRPDDLVRANTILLSAVADDEQAPEFLVGDQVRGALSLAFAEALRGSADRDRDGQISKGELELYVREKVSLVSEGVQKPQIGPIGENDRSLVSLGAGSVARLEEITSENPFAPSFAELPGLRLWTDDPAFGMSMEGREGLSSADSLTEADLIVDFGEAAIFSSIGDRLADLPADSAAARQLIAATIDKGRILARIRALDPLDPLSVSFRGGNGRYREGEQVIADVSGREQRHLWLLHISSLGDLSPLFPLPAYDDPRETDPSNSLGMALEVSPPFGADTILAIQSETPLPDIDKVLVPGLSLREVWQTLHATFGQGEGVSAAAFSFFTEG